MDTTSTVYAEIDWAIEIAQSRGEKLTELEARRLRRRLIEITAPEPAEWPHPLPLAVPPFLRALAVARWLRVDLGTVYDLLAAGEFPNAIRVSAGEHAIWSIPRGDLEAYMRRHQVKADGDQP